MASQFEEVPEDSGSSDSYSHISCEEPEEVQTESTNPTSQNKKKWGFSCSLKVNKRIDKTVLSVNEFGQPNSKEAAEFANCKEWEEWDYAILETDEECLSHPPPRVEREEWEYLVKSFSSKEGKLRHNSLFGVEVNERKKKPGQSKPRFIPQEQGVTHE